MQITEHFSLEELTRSATADKKHITNVPNDTHLANLTKLCEEILEPLRKAYGKPIKITSGYRCAALNKAVGGSATSQHVNGQAVDIQATDGNHAKLFATARKLKLPYDQLIWEYGDKKQPKWVHISLSPRNRRQVLYLFG